MFFSPQNSQKYEMNVRMLEGSPGLVTWLGHLARSPGKVTWQGHLAMVSPRLAPSLGSLAWLPRLAPSPGPLNIQIPKIPKISKIPRISQWLSWYSWSILPPPPPCGCGVVNEKTQKWTQNVLKMHIIPSPNNVLVTFSKLRRWTSLHTWKKMGDLTTS